MKNDKSPQVVLYMLRHFLTVNVDDPLSDNSRGYSDYFQYFSGTGASGQINYLERKPTSSGRFIVKISDVQKTDGTDYDLDRTTLTITWKTGKAPASGSDNILVDYQAIKAWVYDDHPFLDINSFPRITVHIINSDHKTSGMGIYRDYNNSIGDVITCLTKIAVRNRKSNNFYKYPLTGDTINYKNYDLVLAIAEQITNYFQTNRHTTPWKFYDLEFVRSERVSTEEDSGIFREDVTVKVQYYRGG